MKVAKDERVENCPMGISTVVSEKPDYGVDYTDSTSWAEYPIGDQDGYSENERFSMPEMPISCCSFEPILRTH